MFFNLNPIVLAIGCFVCIPFLKYAFTRYQKDKKINALGGFAPHIPTWVPFGLGFAVENVYAVIKHENLEFWRSKFSKYGNSSCPWTVEMFIAGGRVILTADEENIKAILATQFHDYGKGPIFNEEWHEFLGDSIFTTDGERWQASRQLLRPQFTKDRVSDLETIENHIPGTLDLLKGGKAGEAVDIVDVFFRYTLDVATEFLLGSSVDSLKNPQAGFADAFADVQYTQSLIARTGPLNFLVPRKSFRKSLNVMEGFIQPFIEQTLRLSPAELEQKTKSDKGYTFLHSLANFTRDPTVLRDQLAAVLLAGRDSTASALSWLFYELSRHPEVVARLRKDIKSQVGAERHPDYADLKSMRYLQHCINETLRLYPLVPFNVRVALKDTTLPRGGGPAGDQPIGILEGTPIAYSSIVLQRREDIYPPTSGKFPDQREFAPERWENWTPKPWTYIPFNGGPRICIGQQFALTEIAYTTVRILQTFSRLECRTMKPPGLKSEIVLQPAEAVDVVFWTDEGKE